MSLLEVGQEPLGLAKPDRGGGLPEADPATWLLPL